MRATTMAKKTPFPPSRMPASIEFSIKLFVCIIEKIMRIIVQGRNIRLLSILFTRLPVDPR